MSVYLGEYNTRQRLAKLGYKDSIDDLDVLTAEAFCLISSEIDKLEAEDAKKRKR